MSFRITNKNIIDTIPKLCRATKLKIQIESRLTIENIDKIFSNEYIINNLNTSNTKFKFFSVSTL
jgi:hypothetical protein